MSGPKLLGIRDVANPYDGAMKAVESAGRIYQQFEEGRMKAQIEQEKARQGQEAIRLDEARGLRDQGRLEISQAEEDRRKAEAARQEKARQAVENYSPNRNNLAYMTPVVRAAYEDHLRQALAQVGNDEEAQKRVRAEFESYIPHLQDQELARNSGISRLVAAGVAPELAQTVVGARTGNIRNWGGEHASHVASVEAERKAGIEGANAAANVVTAQAAFNRSFSGSAGGEGDGGLSTSSKSANSDTSSIENLNVFMKSMRLGPWDTPAARQRVVDGVRTYNSVRAASGLPPVALDSPLVKEFLNNAVVQGRIGRDVDFTDSAEVTEGLRQMEENRSVGERDLFSPAHVDLVKMTGDQLAAVRSALSYEEFTTQSVNLLLQQLRGVQGPSTQAPAPEGNRLPAGNEQGSTDREPSLRLPPEQENVFDWDAVWTSEQEIPPRSPEENRLAALVANEHDLLGRLQELNRLENTLSTGSPELRDIRTERGRVRNEITQTRNETSRLRSTVDAQRRLETLPADADVPRDLRRAISSDVRRLGHDENPEVGMRRLQTALGELYSKDQLTAAEKLRRQYLEYEISAVRRRLPASQR